MKKSTQKTLAAAIGIAMGSVALTAAAESANPFSATELSGGYMQVALADGKCGARKAEREGKCGEGKCGGSKSESEGKCGEGKCGGSKSESEGKCGEGKCGGSKSKSEGKCGEGKCGH